LENHSWVSMVTVRHREVRRYRGILARLVGV